VSLDVLVVGGGSIGERHLRCFQQTEPCRVSICETLEERRSGIEQTYDVPGYAKIEEAAQQEWDLVIIATPAHLHITHALAFEGSTKNLLVEKPLSVSLEGVDALVRLSSTIPVGVAYVYRAHRAYQALRKMINEDAFGDVKEVTIVLGQHFPTFRPAYREIYYTDREKGGGAVQDAATHLFNLIQYLVGPLDWVFCDYGHQALPGVQVEDTVHMTGRADAERVMLNLSINQFMAPNESYVQVNGTEGSGVVRGHENRYGTMRHGEADWSWSETLLHERDDLFRRQAAHTVDAVLGKSPMLCSLDDAIHTLRINLAALESDGKHRVRID